MQLQAPSQSLKIHRWVAQDFTNKICLQRYKLKSQTRNLLIIYCIGFFNLQLGSMKKGLPHDLWLLEGDKGRNTVSRCWNFLEIWPYPGVFSSAQRNRHSVSDLEIRVATWWLLWQQVNLQPSPFMASHKRPFSELKLSHKPSFSNEKRFHWGTRYPKERQPTARAQHTTSSSHDAAPKTGSEIQDSCMCPWKSTNKFPASACVTAFLLTQ